MEMSTAHGQNRGEAASPVVVGLVKRSVTLSGHRTSVALEPEFWRAIAHQAEQRGITISAFVADVDARRPPQRPLASALRVAVLQAGR